jgi:multidrug efflux pump subunit AcrA (membrane-fusion protein)
VKKIQIGIVYLILIALLSGCSIANKKAENNNEQITDNAQEEIKNKYIMAGKIEASEEVNVASKISARVSEISADIGSNVNAGDVLIKLDTQDLQAQVDQAQAAVNTAQASLANAENSTRPEQIAQAEAALDTANKNYDVANKNYERVKQLVDAGGNTQQQLETAEQQLVSAESQRKNAEEQLNMLKNGPTETSINVYKAQVEQAQAALKTAQTTLNNGTISAPISGSVTAKNIKAGEMASPNTALLTISNPNALVVNAYAPIDVVGDLCEGQDVVIKVSEAGDTTFKGKISVINSKLNSQNRSILVKIIISDPTSELKPGMFAEVGIEE